MSYNSEIHHRRSIRLPGYDYSQPGAYFITICTKNKECLFGGIVAGEMQLNGAGEIVDESWQQITNHFTGVDIDQYIIMPNHFHSIITTVGAGFPRPDFHPGFPRPKCPTTGGSNTMGGETPPLRKATLGQIIGYFKYQSTKQINQHHQTASHPVWQRNYYDHIIRNDTDLNRIREYMQTNPAKWESDLLYQPPS